MSLMPAVDATLDRLEETRQRWWILSLLCHVAAVLFVSIGSLVVCILLDTWLQLSQSWLATLLMAWLTVTAALLTHAAYRRLRFQRTAEATARRIEAAFPELGNNLLNLIQLSRVSGDSPGGFREAAIREAVRSAESVRFSRAATRHSRWQRWRWGLQTGRDLVEAGAALALLGAIIAALGILIPTWRSSADRLFAPWRFVPQVGRVQILDIQPGNASVLAGTRVEIRASVAPLPGRTPQATLFVRGAGAESSAETAREMVPAGEPGDFTAVLPAVTESLQYRLQIGDTQSEIFQLEVCERPAIVSVEVTYEHPEYLRLPDATIRQPHADLDGPRFSVAHLRVHCATPLERGYLQFPEQQIVGRVGEDVHELLADIPLLENTTYTLHLFSDRGQTDPEPRANAVRVVPDGPPAIRWVKPTQEAVAAVDSELPLVIQATDDCGLADVQLEWQSVTSDGPEGEIKSLHRWGCPEDARSLTLTHRMPFPKDEFSAGQVIQVRATAADRRHVSFGNVELGPQQSQSTWLRIRLQSVEQQASQVVARRESLHARLWTVLQNQLRARVLAAECARMEGTERDVKIRDVRQRQVQIQTETSTLVKQIQSTTDDYEAALKGELLKMANGPMLVAVQQADGLPAQGLSVPGDHSPRLLALTVTQDEIISVLRRLLELNRRATAESLAEMGGRPGGDLPPDVEQKLAALAEKMREFIEQQRRVIEATESLAKQPVDNFTEKEEQLLQQLAAAEDDWARFLEETHSDFSKLPEQDFSNPSLLREMVEVQTELKMAADALTKKTADIAVPLEQLGAEMAEELTTNIEKWLPDTPDRERWSQEEPLTDEMKEAPMAELPGELEDLVGELMEDEEDLFDEMEDASSSWADSLDKGAGWDAMDGPISNMSAKGVTGNRLPNDSEIGGRSGEGRQGKSSGEFVADTAVGKGGRKTPSRLAPDPLQKGQIKDVSKDPVGGATGGGKESGVGGEGLEGPVPPSPQRELERMAQRQADLRNRAESIELKFQVAQFHRSDLQKMIEVMRTVEADLKSGRYQSALRRREVLLDGLGTVKGYLGGEFEIRRDQTTDLPADIQKQLLGSMTEASPVGWEELNRRYFERLAGRDGMSGVDPGEHSPAPGSGPSGTPRPASGGEPSREPPPAPEPGGIRP